MESFMKFMCIHAHVPVSQVPVIIQDLENLTSMVLPLPPDFWTPMEYREETFL